jgi:hypothetical protein
MAMASIAFCMFTRPGTVMGLMWCRPRGIPTEMDGHSFFLLDDHEILWGFPYQVLYMGIKHGDFKMLI